MTKQEIIDFLYRKKIIGNKCNKRFNWKSNWDDECDKVFSEFAESYRSNDEAWFCLINNIEPHICEVCGNLAKFTGSKKSKVFGYNTTCEFCSPNQVKSKKDIISNKLKNRSSEEKQKTREKIRKTNLLRYGDENYGLFGSKSFKENLKNKYGDENYNNKEKAKQTCLEKYGCEHNFQMFSGSEHSKDVWRKKRNEILYKRKKTCLEKYGNENYLLSEEFKIKSQQSQIKNFGSIENAYNHRTKESRLTKLKKHNDENFHNKEQASKTIENNHINFERENNCTRYTHIVNEFGQGWKSLNIPVIYNKRYRYISNDYISIIKRYSEENHNLISNSKQEEELYKFVRSIVDPKLKIYRNSKNIIKNNDKKLELDIYIPKLKLAFEYNGNYWHSSLYKDKYYHQIKTKLCYDNNIQLVHIYEYDWINNIEKIKNNIIDLINGIDCSKLNWISVNDYKKYYLTEPEEIKIDQLIIYNEGKFILNENNI